MQIDACEEKTGKKKRNSMTWAQRLKRVFGIDIETCAQCGGMRLLRVLTNRQESRFAQRMLPRRG
jgi:rRNA maturation endonuclease Nob1